MKAIISDVWESMRSKKGAYVYIADDKDRNKKYKGLDQKVQKTCEENVETNYASWQQSITVHNVGRTDLKNCNLICPDFQ